MKKAFIFCFLISFVIAGYGQAYILNHGYRSHSGSDNLICLNDSMLFFNPKNSEVYTADNALLVTLYAYAGSRKDPCVTYSKGCMIYLGYAEHGTRFGAVDLNGNVVVPFKYKKIRDVIKSKEWKAFTPSASLSSLVERCGRTADFMKVKTRLDEYRRARWTEELGKDKIDYWKRESALTQATKVKVEGKWGVVDYYGNYLLDCEYSDILWPIPWSTLCFVVRKDGKPLQTLYRLDGTRLGSFSGHTKDMSSIEVYQGGDYYIRWKSGKKSDNTIIPSSMKLLKYDKEAGNAKSFSSLSFLKNYVNLNLQKWYEKDEFESVEEYQKRTTPEMCRMAQEYFAECALNFYIDCGFGHPFELADYDRANETFLVKSDVGSVPLKVPFANSLAFRKAWGQDGLKPLRISFMAQSDGVSLSALRFMESEETYNGDLSTPYTAYSLQERTTPTVAVLQNPNPVQTTVVRERRSGNPSSDVDRNIPAAASVADHTFALVIANEDYTNLAPVPYALNDGRMFAEYCRVTLGLPERNIRTFYNATYGQMITAVEDIRNISRAYNGDIDVIVYYAGHGAPEEGTDVAHLLPVDASRVDGRFCMSRQRLYDGLAELGARKVTVFMDACFSGHARDAEGGMLALVRGVEADAVTDNVNGGNLVVFSAASGRQSATPYEEKGHGLFTYYLLKKLQESGGKVEYGELWDYLHDNVMRSSAVGGNYSSEPQTPELSVSDNLEMSWRKLTLVR